MYYYRKYCKLYSFIILISLVLFSCGDDDGIDISGISFDGSTIEVKEGFSINLDDNITISGTDSELAEISFISADETVVSVTGNTLTAVSIGSTSVTATESNTNLSATVTVNVTANIVAATGVSLDNTTLDLKVGETSQLTATVAPADATDKALTWSVALPAGRTNAEMAAEDIATVSDAGLVTAISAGEVVITVNTTDGNFTASSTVTITNIAVTEISLDMTSLSVNIGETGQLTASITPSDATNKNITWSLIVIEGDPETYASVDATTGVVTGVSECNACGLALTVTTADGPFTALADLHVVYVPVTSITLDPSSSFTVNTEETQQMTATILPSNASDQTLTWTIEEDGSNCRTNAEPAPKATVVDGLVTGEIPNGCEVLSVVATSVDGPIASTEFNVVQLVTSIRIVDDEDELFAGEDENGMVFAGGEIQLDPICEDSFQLFTTVLPVNATDNDVTWSVSGNATVNSSGFVEVVGPPGIVVVTATANDGSGVSYTIEIEVTNVVC